MRTTWTIWLLAGALAASLQWNLRDRGADGARSAEAGLQRCELDLEALGISSEQARELDRLCRTRCERAAELEAEARESLAALRAALSDRESDEATLRALVREISLQREQSLEAVVESILALRSILDAEQLAAIVSSCCRVQACESAQGSCFE